MRPLGQDDLDRCRRAVTSGVAEIEAVSLFVGGGCLSDGLWRVFGRSYPAPGGLAEWNAPGAWKAEWGLHPEAFHAFAEDLFGNQLVHLNGTDISHMWSHESGDYSELYVSPLVLLETAFQDGIDWVDFYPPGALDVARARVSEVPDDCHLHWTTPLILGGSVSLANTSVVERRAHLVGHAALWREIAHLEPGTAVIVKPPPSHDS